MATLTLDIPTQQRNKPRHEKETGIKNYQNLTNQTPLLSPPLSLMPTTTGKPAMKKIKEAAEMKVMNGIKDTLGDDSGHTIKEETGIKNNIIHTNQTLLLSTPISPMSPPTGMPTPPATTDAGSTAPVQRIPQPLQLLENGENSCNQVIISYF